jgi:tetratricopeptide (TPR) repeat protein
LELDETLAEAHASLGLVNYSFNWNWADAERGFQRAIELNPNYATAHHWHTYQLMLLGRFDEALLVLDRAQEIDPLSLIINATSAYILYFARRYDEAIAHCERALAMEENFSPSQYFLALACEQKGWHDRAGRGLAGPGGRASAGAARDPAWAVDMFQAAGLKSPSVGIVDEDFLRDIQSMSQKNLALKALRRLLNDEINLAAV